MTTPRSSAPASSSPFGFGGANNVASAPCKHGDFSYRELGEGLALRFCGHCGLTHVLLQNGLGAFLLVEVPEHGPEKWAEVSVLEPLEDEDSPAADEPAAETAPTKPEQEQEQEQEKEHGDEGGADVDQDLSGVPPAETERPVSPRPRRARRKTSAVQDVQAPAQPAPDAADAGDAKNAEASR